MNSIFPGAAFGCAILLAWLANHIHAALSLPLLAACLGLPLLPAGSRTALFRSLEFHRRGWLCVLFLAVLYSAGFHLLAWLFIHFYLKTYVLLPSPAGFLEYCMNTVPWMIIMVLAEEFFFRAYLQETVFLSLFGSQRIKALHYRNVAASFLFALAHMVVYHSLLHFYTFFGGLALGWVITRSERSIWPGTMLHLTVNLLNHWQKNFLIVNIPWL